MGQPEFATGPAEWIELVGWTVLVNRIDLHYCSGAASNAVGHCNAKESGGKCPGNNWWES